MSKPLSISAINVVINHNNKGDKVLSIHEDPVIPHDPLCEEVWNDIEVDTQILFVVFKKNDAYFCNIYQSLTAAGSGCQPNYMILYRYSLPCYMSITSYDQVSIFPYCDE